MLRPEDFAIGAKFEFEAGDEVWLGARSENENPVDGPPDDLGVDRAELARLDVVVWSTLTGILLPASA